MTHTFAFLDLETTGLNPNEDVILEAAWLITDEHLVAKRNWPHHFINDLGSFRESHIDNLDEYVYKMHQTSGLLHALSGNSMQKVNRARIEDFLLDDLKPYAALGPVHLAGFSVHFDRGFLDVWLPRVSELLHHRILDLSSIKLLRAAGGLPDIEIENALPHRADHDVMESFDYACAALQELVGDEGL